MEFAVRGGEEYVEGLLAPLFGEVCTDNAHIVAVTDMLIAILNCCTKEELEEEEETPMPYTPETPEEVERESQARHDVNPADTRSRRGLGGAPADHQEQDPGRWTHVAGLCPSARRVGEGLRAQEFVGDQFSARGDVGFGCRGYQRGDPGLRRRVSWIVVASRCLRLIGIRRKSDIENERLPPDIIDVSGA